ncbi:MULTISPECIES: chromate transporter [unclassified Paenibacillus]|uniref:chromate transporter n=1 Tax=unclassified Paenibacillus TaxID=185978 RepID=UPI001E2AC47B|nr:MULTISPECIES: chromate transporter [unclassified Paenibacillus]CAH0119242.1 hypothetical protein PAE9249_01741 [Paenibacillus sp. CECT 9249]
MNKTDAKLLLQLFWSFAKLSPTSFGGGYAMIPLIEREIVTKRKWLNQEELTDMFALTGSLPGTVAINSATLIGYRTAGVAGAAVATFAILLPTFVIVLILSVLFTLMNDSPKINAAFAGIKIATVALIVYAGIRVGRTAISDKTALATAIITILVLLFTPLHPLLVIIGGAAAGMAIMPLKKKLGHSTAPRNKNEQHQIEYYI